MRLAVFSDTHGNTAPMIRAVKETRPDAVVHLGDYDRDTVNLLRAFPGIRLYRVCGNCDMNPLAPYSLTVSFGKVTAFLTHGHQYQVDYRLDSLVYAAQEAGASLVLFGHTHSPCHEDIGGVKVINPGTAGKGWHLSWAQLEIFDNGGIAAEILPLKR